MPEKEKLTEPFCKKSKYQYDRKSNKRDIRWDTETAGFGLRIYPSGKKCFVLSYRAPDGRSRIKTLCAYGDLPVADARKVAQADRVEVYQGVDPLKSRKSQRRAITVAEFAKVYMREHATKHKKSADADQRMLDNIIIPEYGSRSLQSITSADVAELHSKIGKLINNRTGKPKRTQANRVLALISKMYDVARQLNNEEKGKFYVPADFENPAKGIKKFAEVKRDRWVRPDELPRLAKAIDEEMNPVARDALWLYLLTGLRKNELLTLRWSDIDLNRAEIRLPDTKSGRVHYLPLSSAAVGVLRSVIQIHGNPYVLPGKLEGKHLVNIAKPWGRVRKAADVEDVRLHDLRRTVGSWLANAGNSLHLIGRVLNHSNASTTQVYARFGDDPLREAMESHGSELMAIASRQSDD